MLSWVKILKGLYLLKPLASNCLEKIDVPGLNIACVSLHSMCCDNANEKTNDGRVRPSVKAWLLSPQN